MMTTDCKANGEGACTVSCAEVRAGRAQCPSVLEYVPDSGPGATFGVRERPVPVPRENVCQVGQPACGKPAAFVVGVAGVSSRAESTPLPIGGFLHLCDYHSGTAPEGWA
jgi:hypothetical protein